MNVPLFVLANSAWDPYTISNPMYQQFFNWRVSTMTGWSPWADPVTKWFTGIEVPYVDAYAIYPNSDGTNPHPEWCLKSANGTPLYIPFNCSNGTCPQFAGDVCNKAYVASKIAAMESLVASNGYAGVYIDDVNLSVTVSDGNGTTCMALGVTPPSWTSMMIEYVTQVRAALPKAYIIHNPVWFEGDLAARQQQVKQCDIVNIERGFGDPNLNPATFRSLMEYIDMCHAVARPVIQMEYTQANLSFTLACFLLMQQGGDLFSCGDAFPDKWPALLDVDPGVPLGPRQMNISGTGAVTWTRKYTNVGVSVDFTAKTGVIA